MYRQKFNALLPDIMVIILWFAVTFSNVASCCLHGKHFLLDCLFSATELLLKSRANILSLNATEVEISCLKKSCQKFACKECKFWIFIILNIILFFLETWSKGWFERVTREPKMRCVGRSFCFQKCVHAILLVGYSCFFCLFLGINFAA